MRSEPQLASLPPPNPEQYSLTREASSRVDQCVTSTTPGQCQRGSHDRRIVHLAGPPRTLSVNQVVHAQVPVAVPPRITVVREAPTRRAISVLGSPSAARNTIRTSPARALRERTSPSNASRSPSRNTGPGMPYHPTQTTVQELTTRDIRMSPTTIRPTPCCCHTLTPPRDPELEDLDKLNKQSRGPICLNPQNEVEIVIRGCAVALHFTTPIASVN